MLDLEKSHPVRGLSRPHAPANYHIMVIDNEASNNPHSLGATLVKYGYLVSHHSDHRQALKSLYSLARHDCPDLVICDLLGDSMDGLDFLRDVRKTGHLPVMIVTSLESNSTFEKAVIDLGADDFVIKPVRTSELLLRVRLLLRGMPGVAAWRAPELL